MNMVKGKTLFHNLYIGWYFSKEYGLTITDVRCGVCKLPVQPIAIKVADTVYMTCGDGHLVGTANDPYQAEMHFRSVHKQGQVIRFTNRQTYNNNMFEVIQQFKSQFDVEQAVHEG